MVGYYCNPLEELDRFKTNSQYLFSVDQCEQEIEPEEAIVRSRSRPSRENLNIGLRCSERARRGRATDNTLPSALLHKRTSSG